jgi:hypothetical protein
LPGEVKLGEGKPENQNHAIIFTRGDAIQTIDMNQVWQVYPCRDEESKGPVRISLGDKVGHIKNAYVTLCYMVLKSGISLPYSVSIQFLTFRIGAG